MTPRLVTSVITGLLMPLIQSPKQWTTRHGGMLGLKYCLAVHSELVPQLMGSVYERVVKGDFFPCF